MSENQNQSTQTCPGVGSQTAKICLPVSVCPYAVAGPAVVHCCGEMNVVPECDHCRGTVNGSCEFIVTQIIKVDIPVEFGATVKIGETYVECGRVDAEQDGCCHCYQNAE